MNPEVYARLECQKLSEQAESDEGYTYTCTQGEKVFFYQYDHALIPGHIYSGDGIAEFRISKVCEYHFDKWMAEPDAD